MTGLTLTPEHRRWLHRAGGWLMVLGAGLIVAVSVYPCRIELGPIVIRMHSLRNPTMLLLFGYLAWTATVESDAQWIRRPLAFIARLVWQPGRELRRLKRSLVALSRFWSWRQWGVLAVVFAQCLAVILYWQGYPGYLATQQTIMDNLYRQASYTKDGVEHPLLEGFSRYVAEQTPPNARILFRGHTPGLRLSYEVYPRRVFILPQDMRAMAMNWHIQPALATLNDDPQIAYWNARLPRDEVDIEQFIREHRITHIVTFDEQDASACRLTAVETAP